MTPGEGTDMSAPLTPPELSDAMTWTVNPAVAPLLAEHGIVDARSLMRVARVESLGKPGLDSWRLRYRLVLGRSADKVIHLYVKHYRRPPSRAACEARRRCSGANTVAGVEWTWIHELEARGVRCPVPVALGEDVHQGVERESVCVTAEAPGRSLEQCLIALGRDAREAAAFTRAVLRPLAELIRRLHDAGFVHRDLYAAHVFVDDPGASRSESMTGPHQTVLTLIDLQRVMRPRWLMGRWIVKDLASLNYSCPRGQVSRCDRLRWLRAYRGVRRLTPADKRLAQRIEGKTLRIARHDARRRRRLGLTPPIDAAGTRGSVSGAGR